MGEKSVIIKNVLYWIVGLIMFITLLVTSAGLPVMVLIILADLLMHPFNLEVVKLIVAVTFTSVILLSISKFLIDLGRVTIKLFTRSTEYTITKLKERKND